MRLTEVIERFYHHNDVKLSRSLLESVIVPEVTSALNDWIGLDVPGILIGGLALSFYGKPRYTADVDILFVNDADIPKTIPEFTRIRDHAFRHNKTHVEIEVLTPKFLNISTELVKAIITTSAESNGMRVASASGLVALKLQRGSLQDKADIEQLIKTGNINLEPYDRYLTPNQIVMFDSLVS